MNNTHNEQHTQKKGPTMNSNTTTGAKILNELAEMNDAADLRMAHLKALYRGYDCTPDELTETV